MLFSVWAPEAKSVELCGADQSLAMSANETGWWQLETDEWETGDDYGYKIDGEGPFPDPRSPWQPKGVHGLSRTYDHSAYQWHDSHWRAPPLSAAIIYELHVGTFTEQGTFSAAIDKLDYLVELGITHIEVMPVAEFSGDWGWGYDGVSLFAPHHAYGGPEALKQFVDVCHKKGLAVIMDVVYNHLGPSGNYLEKYSPYYFTDHYHTPWGKAVNLGDKHCQEARQFFIDNAKMWLEDYHFDGLRLDAIHALYDQSAIHFLEQLALEVKVLETKLARELVLIAESDLNDTRIVHSRENNGFGLHAQWSDDFHHAMHALFTGERAGYYEDFGKIGCLAKALKQAFVYDGQYSRYRKRVHGGPVDNVTGSQFLGYIQNHDQIGNRANGDRISHLLNTNQLKVAAALVLTSPFVPMLFQGEEWASSSRFLYFTNHPEKDLAKAVSEGRKREFTAFGWNPKDIPDPQLVSTFEHSKLQWQEPSKDPHKEVLEWHKQLISLRKSLPDLSCGSFERVSVEFNESEQWLHLRRGAVSVIATFGDEPVALHSGEFLVKQICLGSSDDIVLDGERLDLPAQTVAILTDVNPEL